MAPAAQGFVAFRDGESRLLGFCATVSLRDATAADGAPTRRWSRPWPTPGAPARARARSCCSTASGWTRRPADGRSGAQPDGDHLLPPLDHHPRLAWSFVLFAEPELWQDTFTYLRFRRAPEAGFVSGRRTYGVFSHDWRAEPAPAWLEAMGQRGWPPT